MRNQGRDLHAERIKTPLTLGLQPFHQTPDLARLSLKPYFLLHLVSPSLFLGLGLVGFISHTRGRFKLLLIREGRRLETKEKQSRSALGQGPVSPSMDTYHNIFELLADTETPSRWEKLTRVFCPQACRPQTSWTRGLMMLTPTYLIINPLEECPQVDYALFEQLL